MNTREKISALLIDINNRKSQMSEEELLRQIDEIKRMQIYLDIASQKRKKPS
jgi:hypothetical protein